MMAGAGAIIDSKLEALRRELAEKQAAAEAYERKRLEEAMRRQEEWEGWYRKQAGEHRNRPDDGSGGFGMARGGFGTPPLFNEEDEKHHDERLDEMRILEAQLRLLEEVKESVDKQHAATQAHFLAIKDRDERSSRQNVWLTVASSVISLILGWLLSFLGSPASVLHALVH